MYKNKNWFTPKYLFLYLVVAVVVYGLVYYFFWGKSKYGSSSLPVYDMSSKDSYKYKVNEAKTMSVVLKAQNGSEILGTAVFLEVGGKTKATLSLNSSNSSVPLPAHIHMGACPTPGAVKFPLASVVNGVSETTLDTTIDALNAMLPLAVNVHKSAVEIGAYVACGNLTN